MTEAWGRGLATLTGDGRVLDVLFGDPQLGLDGALAGPGTTELEDGPRDERRGVRTVGVATVLDDLEAAPTGACGAAVAHVLRGGDSPVTVELDGGELKVDVDEALHVDLEGWAIPVFKGEVS